MEDVLRTTAYLAVLFGTIGEGEENDGEDGGMYSRPFPGSRPGSGISWVINR